MKSIAKHVEREQLDLDIPDTAADDLDPVLLERLLVACRRVANTMTVDECATALEGIWGERNRPVAASQLRAALNSTERNYFRVEWAFWFSRHSEEVRDLLLEVIGHGKPKKPPDVGLRDLKTVVREAFPKHADALFRKAELL